MSSIRSSSKGFFNGHPVAFIGGGNMASAMLGGLVNQGVPLQQLMVIEPFEPARQRLQQQWGIKAQAQANPDLTHAAMVVWAVKPQTLREAALSTLPFLDPNAVHLSIAAGIRVDTIQHWTRSSAVVRAMPNTPALIGKGITGLFAAPSVDSVQKEWVNQLMRTLGEFLWMDKEADIDAVTALSGSGPAYVFYFAEAMVNAGIQLGLSADQARQLALSTFQGAASLAQSSATPLAELRDQVTSKGGTTFAAINSMQSDCVQESVQKAVLAAADRAREMGHEMALNQSV